MLLLWPIIALAITAVAWMLIQSHLDEQEALAIDQANQTAAGAAQSYAIETANTFRALDRLLLMMKHGEEAMRGEGPAHGIDLPAAFPREEMTAIVVAANGRAVSASDAALIGRDFATVDAFRAQRSAAADYLYIGAPLHEGSGPERIAFSRRIEADGAFAGVALLLVPAAQLTRSYNAATLGEGGLLALIGRDGIERVSRVADQRQHRLADDVPQRSGLATANGHSGLAPANWFADGRARYLASRPVEAFPVVALAGVDARQALAAYQVQRSSLIRAGILATAVLMLFKFIAMGLTIRLAWRKHQMELGQTTYRMATEEGGEGFYISRPIRDAAGQVVDFMTVDCNQRGAGFFRMRREQLIGTTVRQLYRGRDPKRLMKALNCALKHGNFEDEVQVQTEDLLTTQWLHLKILRANGDLAVRLRDVSQVKAHMQELERQAHADALTGLPNRQWMLQYLPQAIRHADEAGGALAVLFLDLDGFKTVNDTLGHSAGDELLQLAARRLKVAIRPHDHIARLGGDEFVVIVEAVHSEQDVVHVAERVLNAFGEPFGLKEGRVDVGTSIGISVYPQHGRDAETLLKHADIAMYAVKAAGKRNYRLYSVHLYDALRQRLDNERELKEAIEHGRFAVHYQPRVAVRDHTVVGMEALVRWEHPRRGLLHPDEFIALAEETGLIVPLGALVLERVCTDLARWRAVGVPRIPVSVNVSARQFAESDVPRAFADALRRHGLGMADIEIELTESSMMDTKHVSPALKAVQAMGIRLLIDDFGTGYSSLSQLQRLDFDVLKVDKAFTMDVNKREQGTVFFSAIITMAHALGMRVVAEGVENDKQLQILRTLQCDEVQGFLISRPQPASAIPALLA